MKKLWMLFLVIAAVTAIPQAHSGRLPDEVMCPAIDRGPAAASRPGFDWVTLSLASVALVSAASLIAIGTEKQKPKGI